MNRGLGKWERYILENATDQWVYLNQIFQKWAHKELIGNYPPEPSDFDPSDYGLWSWCDYVDDLRWSAFKRAARSLERKGLIRRRHWEEFITVRTATAPSQAAQWPYWNRRSVQVKKV